MYRNTMRKKKKKMLQILSTSDLYKIIAVDNRKKKNSIIQSII